MNFISKLLTSQMSRNVASIPYRNYPRWTSRSPLKVLSPDGKELTENEDKNLSPKEIELNKQPLEEAIKIKWRYQVNSATPNEDDVEVLERVAKSKVKKPSTSNKPKIKTTDMLETVINENGQFVYTKMKNNDARVGQLLTTAKSKKLLTKKDLILLEGKRLIRDALLAGCSLKYLIFTRKNEIEYLKPDLPRSGAKMFKMPYKEMQMWSDLTTSPGIMGLFRTPDPEQYICKEPIPLSIYCDNVREPGNLGAILRVAASAGCQKVMLSPGCTNLWDSKVTRSSAGSHFRIQILPRKSMDELREEFDKSNGQKTLYIADNNLISTEHNASVQEGQNDLENLINQIPMIPYYDVNVRESNKQGKEIVLVIGGETHGIHEDIYKLAKDVNGVRLNIPMSNGVDSLNTGTAVGIITFELHRQFKTGSSLN